MKVDIAAQKVQRVAAVIGAHIELREREMLLQEFDDLHGRLAFVDADRDENGVACARSAQHVETRAVAVIDLKAEAPRRADLVGVAVDGGHVYAARHQELRHHLPEAAEADDEHPAIGG